MRAGRSDVGFIEHEGQFVGINLGWDFVSEHEWSIKGIDAAFGISQEGKLGFDGRTITKCPAADLHWIKGRKHAYLVFCRFYQEHRVTKEQLEATVGRDHYLKNLELATSWDGQSFGIRVSGQKNILLLEELHAAFKRHDITIFIGQSGPFSNSGLKLCIASRIPQEAREAAIEASKDAIALQQAAEATGIEKKLKGINHAWRQEHPGGFDLPCGWYALSPRWCHSHEQARTKHPVIFWLNPMQQKKNNFGWFTVEELELWAEGQGPILMTHGQEEKRP